MISEQIEIKIEIITDFYGEFFQGELPLPCRVVELARVCDGMATSPSLPTWD
jgi:hypothetical protein